MFLWVYLLFTSIFAYFAIVWIDLPETAGVLTSLLWMLCILFCGIGVPRADLPGFWTFMYRASPATYLVGGIMSTAVANNNVTCADYEVLYLSPPFGGNMSCGEFLGPFAEAAGGRVLDTAAVDNCGYCPIDTTNDFFGTV
jgi:ATP-binding cassette subfamily G (WHITE) protein 2 (PDR)